MPRSYIPIDKIGSEGLREDQPSTSKLWRELKNLRRGTGGWRRRPGLSRIEATLPSTVNLGLPKIIYTFTPPEVTFNSEVLRPTSVVSNQWDIVGAATAWEAVDDITPDDDASYINTSTTGEEIELQFAPSAEDFSGIRALVLKLRVKRDATKINTLSFWVLNAGTYYQFGSQASYSISAGTGYVELSVDSSTNPVTGIAWAPTDLATFKIVIRKGAAEGTTTESVLLGGFPVSLSKSTTNDSQLSAAFPSTALSPISSASLRWSIQNTFSPESASVLLTIDNQNVGSASLASGVSQTFTSVITPTQAAVGKRVRAQTGAVTAASGFYNVTSVQLIRQGISTGLSADIRITSVNLVIEGTKDVDEAEHLFWLTTEKFFRYSGDLTAATDVRGGVGILEAGENAFWDHTIFQDHFYVVNGLDPLMQYPSPAGLDEFDAVGGTPVGDTISTYSARLILGSVLEGGVKSPSRVRFSAIDAPTDWTSQTSGNLELNETRGRVLKLQPLVEAGDTLVGVLAAYKEQGIYHITPTETAADPFRKKLMDGSAGMIAPASLVGFSDRNGREAHAFLGHVGGTINVLAWNGGQIQQFGWEVQDILYSLGDIVNLEHAQGAVDSFGNYVLLFPTTDARFLRTALVYNFNHKVWSMWEVGNVTALGQWRPSTGRPITVFGRPDGLPYRLDEDVATDDFEVEENIPIEAVWVTGDLALAGQEFWREATLQRIWIFYQKDEVNPAFLTFDVSTDGGDSYRINEADLSVTAPFGAGSGIALALIDTRITARKVAVRITSDQDDGRPEPLQIILETEISGTVPNQQT